jgi:hypothetical protein
MNAFNVLVDGFNVVNQRSIFHRDAAAVGDDVFDRLDAMEFHGQLHFDRVAGFPGATTPDYCRRLVKQEFDSSDCTATP